MQGNYIHTVCGYEQVIDIMCDCVNTKSNTHLYADIMPIKIDPEILLKAGAVNKYDCEFFIGKLKFTYEINELSQFVRFHYSGKVTYLQYVHELQNLLKALTSTELKIEL